MALTAEKCKDGSCSVGSFFAYARGVHTNSGHLISQEAPSFRAGLFTAGKMLKLGIFDSDLSAEGPEFILDDG